MPARRSHDRDSLTTDRARTLGPVAVCACVIAVLWTSSGHPDIQLDDEISLGNWSPNRTLYRRDVAVCISNGGNGPGDGGRFRLVAQGETPGAFALTNAIDDRIPYALSWSRSGNSNADERLLPGVPSQRSYRFDNPNSCKGGNGSGLRVVIESADVDAAPPGRYDDVLQLTLVIE